MDRNRERSRDKKMYFGGRLLAGLSHLSDKRADLSSMVLQEAAKN